MKTFTRMTALILVFALCLSVFTGCSKSKIGGADATTSINVTSDSKAEVSSAVDTTEEKSLTGTLSTVKDFLFTVTDDAGTPYDFAFETKPEGLDKVKEGEKVTVFYKGALSEVDAFTGTIVYVERAESVENVEEKQLTGTLSTVKDFLFTVTDDAGTPYDFAFETKPEGLDTVAEGDKVTVTYSGDLSEVDAFTGTVYSVEKVQEIDETEQKTLTGTIDNIKDFLFTVTDDAGTPYDFAFETKPEGLDKVKEGDKVTVTYTGALSEVDAFTGTVVSVEKAQETASASKTSFQTYEFETFDGEKVTLNDTNILSQEQVDNVLETSLVPTDAEVVAPGRDYVYLADDSHYYVEDATNNLLTIATK